MVDILLEKLNDRIIRGEPLHENKHSPPATRFLTARFLMTGTVLIAIRFIPYTGMFPPQMVNTIAYSVRTTRF